MSKYLLCFLLSFCVLRGTDIFAQDPTQYGTPFTGVPDIRDVTMYQVNIRAFSPTHDFNGITQRLDSIKALGINVIYLMPIYPVGHLRSVNSPYCIQDFDSVGTEYGTLSDLHTLVDSAHSLGMAVILDFVVNQTSWDHPWITQHPDWYVQDSAGQIQQLSTYTDVAALNFADTSMRAAIISAMRFWVFTVNIDGFRCDFADNPPVDFWQQAINSLRSISTHKLIMMAEGTRAANYTAGFDYNFGYQFYYNSLKPIYTSGTFVTAIDNSNIVEYDSATGDQQIIRFLTNHDENGSDGTPLQLFGGEAGSMAAFAVVAYMKGIPFIYNGQEVAFPTPITFPYTSVTIDWAGDYAFESEYQKVIAFRNSSTAIRRGVLQSYTGRDVCAFTKTDSTNQVLVISNLRGYRVNYTYPTGISGTTWYDAFTGLPVTLDTLLDMTPYQYMVLTKSSPASIGAIAQSDNNIKIYPNPMSGDQFTISVPGLASYEKPLVVISDIEGEMILSTDLPESGRLSAHFTSGIYLVTVQTQSGNITKKLVVL